MKQETSVLGLIAVLVPFLNLALFSRLAQASARALPSLKESNYCGSMTLPR